MKIWLIELCNFLHIWRCDDCGKRMKGWKKEFQFEVPFCGECNASLIAKYSPSQATLWWTKPVVFLHDEFNEVEPAYLEALRPLLDDSKSLLLGDPNWSKAFVLGTAKVLYDDDGLPL